MKMGRTFKRENCRLCLNRNLSMVIALGATPIGDQYLPEKSLHTTQKCYPLELYLCNDCGLLQLLNIIDPEEIYTKYIYLSSDSKGLVEHFGRYSSEVINFINPPKNALVVDIGSNDGSFLNFFKKSGLNILGIDPAEDIAKSATENGIETIHSFFLEDLAEKIKKERGKAYLITINNALANIDDLTSLLSGVKNLLADDGVFIFETGYVLDLIQKCIFDNIYHEHISYFAVKPLETFFRNNGMELIDVKRIPTKGGSIRCIVQFAHGKRKASANVREMIEKETAFGLFSIAAFNSFKEKLESLKTSLNAMLADLKKRNFKIAGYGASVGVTTMLYYFGIRDYMDFLADDNTRRQNLYSPGLHMPVKSPDDIYSKKIDYVLILAWQYAEIIISRHKEFLKKGGHFILPLPELKIVRFK